MGIENISASQVSEFNKELDAQDADIRSRPLAPEYPFLWIDALHQKVRVEGRVVSAEDSWRVFFRKLKARGMKRTALC